MGKTYHHGDLRRELLDAAARALEKVGYENLSMRELAQAAGVSSGAPYRHFASREELLLGVALQGAAALEDAYAQAAAMPRDAKDRLRAVCRAYVSLAQAAPQLFRLMFESEIVVGADPLPEWLKATHRAFAIFQSAIHDVAPQLDEADLRLQTAFVWATIHGLSSMHIHGRLHRFRQPDRALEDLIEPAIDQAVLACVAAGKRMVELARG
jgi:AcrR family transcriptional regulator